eukprot:CAMPEP_0172521822 /NCGR_PEP_ID=MMETSP1066-20121228/292796_1 /TAXON_ID=671091 /ORGANISM="Coscinodiscus wailesii, Strain CCMP2513" /LENGTH=332 /DNA_ID=CAMNT_0013304783 /DNA_START=136 /DNA_END=1134 /DNA_ORIENTATION=+
MLSPLILPFLLVLLSTKFIHDKNFVTSFSLPVITPTKKYPTPSSVVALKQTIKIADTGSTSSVYSAGVKDVSSQLLSLALARWNNNNGGDEDAAAADVNAIERLMLVLINSRVSFDPDECLTGPFYATIYTSGTSSPPLWETLARFSPWGGRRNIQGQQYLKGGGKGDDGDDESGGRVINYSELFGPAFHLKASGTFTKKSIPSPPPPPPPSSSTTTKKETTLVDKLLSLLPFNDKTNTLPNDVPRQNPLVQCPADWIAAVDTACVGLPGGNDVAIPIQGTGTVRVLYADPRLRIFTSLGNTDSRWEETGLTVIQVRIDLVDEMWDGGRLEV